MNNHMETFLKNYLATKSNEMNDLSNKKDEIEDEVSRVLDMIPIESLEEIQEAKEICRNLTMCATKVLFFKKLITAEEQIIKSIKADHTNG